MKTCKQCGQQYEGHGNEYCSRECRGASQRKRVFIRCNTCGKDFETTPKENRQYCSKSCFYKYRQGKAVRPRKRVNRVCRFCGKAFDIIPSWLKGGGGKFCSKQCTHDHKKTITGKAHPLYKDKIKLICKFCGKTYYRKPAVSVGSKFCSRKCHGGWLARNIHSPTTIEIAMGEMLDSMGVVYEAEKGIGPWLCDFVVESSALVIETDGVYWHSLPERKKKDQQKDRWLNTHGYAVLRLGENDINKRPEWCKRQIQSLLMPTLR